MRTDAPDARDSTTLASSPTQDHPHVPVAGSTRFLPARNGGASSQASPAEPVRGAPLRWAFSRIARTALYAVLAALLGVFVDFLEGPPTVVTAIIVATGFCVLIANDVSLRRRA
jgi:hypothetical protein